MREYQHHATEATITALRRLRRAWVGFRVANDAMDVALVDGAVVRIRVDGTDIEPMFQAFRLSAELVEMAEMASAPLTAPGTFDAGSNDVVVFRSETWIEGSAEPGAGALEQNAVFQFTGSPLQRSPTAAAVCAVDDAVVLASVAGAGLLVRCALRPRELEVTSDPEAIARFLAQRHYSVGPADH